MLAWRVFAKMFLKSIDQLSVSMERLSFKRTTILKPNTDITFYVNILRKTGEFEIFESGSLVATGNIKILEKLPTNCENYEENNCSLILNGNDFYKECLLRKVYSKDDFRGVTKFDLIKKKADIQWFGKYDCFLNNLIQVVLLADYYSRDIFLPTFIGKLVIDAPLFIEKAIKHKGKKTIAYVKYSILVNLQCRFYDRHS